MENQVRIMFDHTNGATGEIRTPSDFRRLLTMQLHYHYATVAKNGGLGRNQTYNVTRKRADLQSATTQSIVVSNPKIWLSIPACQVSFNQNMMI